jgi:hypothetical protein
MKTLLLLFGIYFLCVIKINAQNSTLDTSAYLKDSIVVVKQKYIGMPLNKLFSDLKILIVDNNEFAFIGSTDTFYTKSIKLNFFYLEEFYERILNKRITPILEIKFNDTIAIPRSYFNKGEMLDYYTGWNKYKRNFWGKFIVADIRVSGIK